jgi:hypothetical protein
MLIVEVLGSGSSTFLYPLRKGLEYRSQNDIPEDGMLKYTRS